jgi:hypothetical protein
VDRRPSRERLWLLGLIAISVVVRTLVATRRSSPLYYPDEYLYSALARSIAASGRPEIRGSFVHFPALLGPYLMSPAWLISGVEAAYRVALAWGALWFSLAAYPAFELARRIGVSASGALFVAFLALLVPDAAFTTTLLSEPYAYPTLLATVLFAVETIARPTRARQVVVLVLMLALCLIRAQFVIAPVAYLVAALAVAGFSPRRLLRAQTVVLGVLGAALVVSLVVGVSRLAGSYSGLSSFHVTATGIAHWFGLDLFVLAVAAGWVLVPGAAIGFVGLARSQVPRRRAFAWLSLTLLMGLLGQAAVFGAHEQRVHERYVYYLVPLIVIAFAWAAESLARDWRYAAVAYICAGAAVLLPLASGVRGAADDESPTLLGLTWLTGGGDRGTLAWAIVLAVAAVVTGLRVGGRRVTRVLGAVIVLSASAAASVGLLRFGSTLGAQLNLSNDVPHVHAPQGSALVTFPDTNRFLLMKTLFWNPAITRVAVLGRGASPDGYASTGVRLAPGRGFVDGRGRPLHGPFAFDTDTAVATAATHGALPAVLGEAPSVVVSGWNRSDGYLETVSRLIAAAGRRPLDVAMTVVSPDRPRRVSLRCSNAHRTYTVGTQPTTLRVLIPARSRRECLVSLVAGTPVVRNNRTVGVRGTRLEVRVHPIR